VHIRCIAAALAAAWTVASAAQPAADLVLYGVVDVGVSYELHGMPSNDSGSVGSAYLVQKGGNHATWTLSQSGLGQSRLGAKGSADLGGDWSALFRLESAINPAGGNLTDGIGSIIRNNGLPQAQTNAFADSSSNGQVFARAALAGISHPVYGSLTAGRQSALQGDMIAQHDPMAGAFAFSFLGFFGYPSGSGSSEVARWDNSVKYLGSAGIFRFAAMASFGGAVARDDGGYAADLGLDWKGLTADLVHTRKQDEVSAAPLTMPQMLGARSLGLDPGRSFAATVFDAESWSAGLTWHWQSVQLSGGAEIIRSANPEHPLALGFVDVGGYAAGAVNNAAFSHPRRQTIGWLGLRYTPLPLLDLSAAAYRLRQNSYAVGAEAGCSDGRAPACAGNETVLSALADWHLSAQLDSYAGVAYSHVVGGLASGFYHAVNAVPTIGLRYRF